MNFLKFILKIISMRISGLPIRLSLSRYSRVTTTVNKENIIVSKEIIIGLRGKSLDLALYHELSHYYDTDFDENLFNEVSDIISKSTDIAERIRLNALYFKRAFPDRNRPIQYSTLVTEEIMANARALQTVGNTQENIKIATEWLITYLPADRETLKNDLLDVAMRYFSKA